MTVFFGYWSKMLYLGLLDKCCISVFYVLNRSFGALFYSLGTSVNTVLFYCHIMLDIY